MKHSNILLIILFTVFLLNACSDDFMNIDPPKEITADAVWTEGALAEAYMYNIYFAFQDAGFAEETQASATDETLFIHGREYVESNAGALTDANLAWFGKTQGGHQWERLYRTIRSCNDFIKNIDNATFEDSYKVQLKGEAYFLRAYFCHRLSRGYGGIPLQLEVTQLADPDFFIVRSSYTETVQQILSDIDNAAGLLKDRTFSNTQKGRATLAAVLALKVRVLTDAASDLHDQAAATAKISTLASYQNKELLFYTEGSREDRWRAAKNAAKALMDNPLGHGLTTYGGEGLSAEEKADAIWEFFGKESEEHIFSRYFIETKDESGTKMALFNGPSGYHAWGGNVPVQDLVDAYLMADGSKFDWNKPEHKANPYKNREPRFYASILYDGKQWYQRPADYAAMEASGMIQTGYYQLDPADAKDAYFAGMDTRSGGGETWNATYTGYYLRKFIHPRDGDHRNRVTCLFPFIRFSEIVYDYVEACIELGELEEARTYFNMFRKRIGLPEVTTTSKDELRQLYREDRRLEFLMEEHRYWDVRRWIIGKECPGMNSLYGVEVIATLKPGVGKQSGYVHDETRWDYTYTRIPLAQEKREFVDKTYFLPIHRDERNRNEKLIQNPGY